MTQFKQPHWSALPARVTSLEAAALLQIKTRTLQTYVRRGQLRPAVEHTHNKAWYLTADVRACWEQRQLRQAQFYDSDAPDAGLTQAAGAGDAAVKTVEMTTANLAPEMQTLLKQAIQEGVQQGIEAAIAPLISEIAGVRAALERAEAGMSSVSSSDAPSPWQKFLTRWRKK